VDKGLMDYNPSFAINAIRNFFWSVLCDWYLELIKPRLNTRNKKSAALAQQILALCLDQVLRLLHPFLPFITEHLWQILSEFTPERGLGKIACLSVSPLLINAAWPKPFVQLEDEKVNTVFSYLQDIIRAIREVRAIRNIPPKQELVVTLKPQQEQNAFLKEHVYLVKELAHAKQVTVDTKARRTAGSASILVVECQIYIHDIIDDKAEIARLKAALEQVEKEIAFSQKKLDNTNFVERAPQQVVNKQRQRLQEHQRNRETILKNLKNLGENI